MSERVHTRVFSRKSAQLIEKADTNIAASETTAVKDPGSLSESGQSFGEYAVVKPPLNPKQMLREHTDSSALRQNVDAYTTNIHGYGFALDPVFDFGAADIEARVLDAIWLDENGLWGDLDAEPAPPEQVADMISKLRVRTQRETMRASTFFKRAGFDKAWVKLTQLMRQDLETCGYAFFEIKRDAVGRLAGFAHVQPQGMVALKSKELIEVDVPVLHSPLRWETRSEERFGHLWGQTDSSEQVKLVFKGWRDPRVISSKTAKTYASVEQLQAEEPGTRPATELVQFKIDHSLSSFFGFPRWFGNIKSVQGSRKAEGVNLLYFDSKGVPPLAILVSGGSLTEAATDRIETFIEDELKGAENFHKILLIEAEPAKNALEPLNSGKIRIELVPLTAAQHDDGLFMRYLAKCRDMIGESMRNPRIVRGDIDGINRATATAALAFAESQVYAPLREHEWDWWVNHCVMFELGCSVITYRTQSPVATDIDLAMAVAELTKANVLVPNDGRQFAARAFNRQVETISEPWTKQPMPLTLAQQLTGGTGDPERRTEGAVGATQSQAATKMLSSLVDKQLEVHTLRLPGPLSQYFVPHDEETDGD